MPADPRRPAYHFSPARHWMNDPNGLVWYDGEYHLFFQHNPYGTDWGNMSWGHAVSTDLFEWQELPVALPATATEHVFSGSVVVDHDNTSGLGGAQRPAMVALYTSADVITGRQAQAVAYSLDRGRTWERYAGNPVIDLDSTDFRDPKVFRYEPDGCWVMVVVLAEARTVRLYRSDDLLVWDHLSDFGPEGSVTGVWECPDLFPLPVDDDPTQTRWVLLVSVQDGAVAGGSGMQYFVGDFDGVKFSPSTAPAEVRWVDHGADHYAAVSFADEPLGRRVVLGWMSNWAYAEAVPATDSRGAMTLPREYSLRSVDGAPRLVQRPLTPPGLSLAHRAGPRALAEGRHPVALGTPAHHLVVDVELELHDAVRAGVLVRVGEDQHTAVGYDAGHRAVYVDRTASGTDDFHPGFAAVHRAPYATTDGVIRLQIHVDSCSVEVFADDGGITLTDLILPDPDSDGVALFADGGTARLRSLHVARVDPPSPSAPETPADLPGE